MIVEEKVAGSQMMFLLVTVVGATAFLFVPAITSQKAGPDGWMSELVVATSFGILVALTCTKLGMYFPSQSLVEYAPELVGKWAGKLIGLLYIFFFIHINAIIVREFGDLLLTAFLPETPLLVFNITVMLLAVYAVWAGLEVIVRINQLLFPIFIGVLAIIILGVLGDADWGNLTPVLEHGLQPVLAGAITTSAWRGEVAVILMFMPFLNQPGEAKTGVIFAVLLIGFLLSVTIVTGVAVFGAEQNALLVFPTMELARYVSLGVFFERLEAVIIIVWVAGITIKVAAFHLASILACAQWLGLKNYRVLAVPVGIITLIYSIALFDNTRELVKFFAEAFPYYAWVFELFLPVLLLLVAVIRKKRGQV